MATVSDTELALAEVYGKAMIGLAVKRDEVDSLFDELRDLSAMLDTNAAFSNFVASPTIDLDRREGSIEKIFRGKASDLLVDTLQVLNRKGRMPILGSIIEAYRLAHQKLRGRIDVNVRTAVPLTDEHRRRLSEIVKARYDKEAVLIEEVDEQLIGGMVVFASDQKLDASVTKKLAALRTAFMERASQEIHGSERVYVTGAG